MASKVNHYLRDGTLHKGGMHKHADGTVMTGAKMSGSAKALLHYGDLSNLKWLLLVAVQASLALRLIFL